MFTRSLAASSDLSRDSAHMLTRDKLRPRRGIHISASYRVLHASNTLAHLFRITSDADDVW